MARKAPRQVGWPSPVESPQPQCPRPPPAVQSWLYDGKSTSFPASDRRASDYGSVAHRSRGLELAPTPYDDGVHWSAIPPAAARHEPVVCVHRWARLQEKLGRPRGIASVPATARFAPPEM